MTDLDKLEDALNCKNDRLKIMEFLQKYPADLPSEVLADAARAHLSAQRQGAARTMQKVEICPGVEVFMTQEQIIAWNAEKHGKAQRQGGDADVSFISAVTALDVLAKGCYDTSLSASTITALTDKVRAALLSAQGGVPGEVLEKVAETINSLRNRLIQHNHRGDDRDDDILFEAQSTLTLLTPYLNNGRGG